MVENSLVSVIVVNYNGREFIGECIDSVLAADYSQVEAVVVDNGSTDGSWEYLQERYGRYGRLGNLGDLGKRRVKIIRSESNLFFAGGCNRGAREAKGEYLFFLNSDTMVEKRCIEQLVKFVEGKTKILVQPKILRYQKSDALNIKKRRFLMLATPGDLLRKTSTPGDLLRKTPGVIDNVGGRYSFLGLGYGIGHNEEDRGQYDKNRRVDFVNGTAFMIGRDFFWALGGFDEEFKFFYEDVDLCLRAKKAGAECWCYPKAAVYHKGSMTFSKTYTNWQIKLRILCSRLYLLWKRLMVYSVGIKKLLSGAGIVFAGTVLVNGINFLFSLTMARILGPQAFGEIAAIFSLLLLGGVPAEIVATVATKYSATFQAQNRQLLIKKLFVSGTRLSLKAGAVLMGLFILSIPWLSSFFHIQAVPFLIFSLSFPLLLVSGTATGILLGLRQFLPYSLTSIIATGGKFVLSLIFVKLGFSVSGVMGAFIFGLLLAYLYLVGWLHKLLAGIPVGAVVQETVFKLRQEIFVYARTVFSATLLLSILGNLDLLLAKHYLSAIAAGQYAALAMLAKSIFYLSAPFLTVVFPRISVAYAAGKQQEQSKWLKIALAVITVVSFCLLVIFGLLSEQIMQLLFGKKYLAAAPYLFWLGLAIALNTLSRLLIGFFLAVSKSTFFYPLVGSFILELGLIYFYHQNILAFILALLASNFLLLLSCGLGYFFRRR